MTAVLCEEPGCGRDAVVLNETGARCDRHMNNTELVEHPAHYGGADNPYEAIKVIDAWRLGFCLGNAVKYIARAGKKPGSSMLQDLKKARFYIDHAIAVEEPKGSAAEPVRCPAMGYGKQCELADFHKGLHFISDGGGRTW